MRRSIAITSSLDNIQPARSRSPPTAIDRQPDPRIHTPRTIYLPGECRNWHLTYGASALASDPSTLELKPRNCDKWRPERGAAAIGTHLDLQEDLQLAGPTGGWPDEGHDKWQAQSGADQIEGCYNGPAQRGAGQMKVMTNGRPRVGLTKVKAVTTGRPNRGLAR